MRKDRGQEDGGDRDKVPSLRAQRQGLRTGSGPRKTGWSQRAVRENRKEQPRVH